MKNRFIRKFLVICAAMLFVCAVSVWAAAEGMTPATPTDLMPEITEPETTEPEAGDEEAADAVEIIITKAVGVGDSWSGVMKKTKPAILKLDVAQAQQVNLLVQGRHVWITVEKADSLTDTPARTLTENSQAIISWYAEAGSYLITLGPVEPNLMAKANVAILDDATYGEWLAQQQAEEATEEEPTEATEESEEPAEEKTEEPDEITEEEKEELPVDETTDETETGEEPDEDNPEDTEENIPESELKPERHIRVDVTWDVPDPIIGDTAHFAAVMEGYDELQYTVQWQYSPDENTWYDIPNETNTTMDVVVTPENNIVYWRILVYVEESQED